MLGQLGVGGEAKDRESCEEGNLGEGERVGDREEGEGGWEGVSSSSSAINRLSGREPNSPERIKEKSV